MNKTKKRLLLLVLKDFSRRHTISSLANLLNLSRVGVWKIVKNLQSQEYIVLQNIGERKAGGLFFISLNWDNPLIEKMLSLYLTEEAMERKRWMFNFNGIADKVTFSILFGSILYAPKKANDIDILNVSKKNMFVKLQKEIDRIQKSQIKKIHAISFTQDELKEELHKPNKTFIEAIDKGIILFGQDNFVKFMKKMST